MTEQQIPRYQVRTDKHREGFLTDDLDEAKEYAVSMVRLSSATRAWIFDADENKTILNVGRAPENDE